MRLVKRGILFNTNHCELPLGCISHAQSPQALLLHDRVRIYFSTRCVDSTGQFLSHVAYVDYSKDFSTLLGISRHKVIELGDLGCFDEHGIFPFHVFRRGACIWGYISGWSRRTSVPVETSIGLAISYDDGATFQRIGPGPVLGPSPNEPFLVGDPFVLYDGNSYHMWYIFGVRWSEPSSSATTERTYKIGHATSIDGIQWSKNDGHQVVSDILGPDECQALPAVIRINNLYHMFFCYRETLDFRSNPQNAYRIGYATSRNLIHWSRNDLALEWKGISDKWDANMMCYPHAFEMDGRFYLLYNGNDFGRLGFGLAEICP